MLTVSLPQVFITLQKNSYTKYTMCCSVLYITTEIRLIKLPKYLQELSAHCIIYEVLFINTQLGIIFEDGGLMANGMETIIIAINSAYSATLWWWPFTASHLSVLTWEKITHALIWKHRNQRGISTSTFRHPMVQIHQTDQIRSRGPCDASGLSEGLWRKSRCKILWR